MNTACEAHGQISEEQKATLRGMAQTAGLTVDDFLWQALLAFKSKREQHAIAALFEEIERTAERTCASVDATIAYIDASNQRIAEMEARTRRDL